MPGTDRRRRRPILLIAGAGLAALASAALAAPPVLIAYLASELVTLEKVNALNGLATTYCAAMGTIVVAFMAAQAYVRGKTSDA